MERFVKKSTVSAVNYFRKTLYVRYFSSIASEKVTLFLKERDWWRYIHHATMLISNYTTERERNFFTFVPLRLTLPYRKSE